MSAIISPCGKYRYRLERTVGMEGPVYAFFGVNPSTADANLDDATVRKWTGFVKTWGGSRLIVGNVNPFRATDVRELAANRMTIGALHDQMQHLDAIVRDADILVPCWGNRSKAKHLGQDFDIVLAMLLSSGKPVKHFGLTKGGDPKHPLMLGYNTPLTEFRAAASIGSSGEREEDR